MREEQLELFPDDDLGTKPTEDKNEVPRTD